MPVPAEMQSVLFGKILKYDRTLRDHMDDLTIHVVHDGEADELTRELVRAFVATGLTARATSSAAVAKLVDSKPMVLYVRVTNVDAQLAKLCESGHVLSLSGWPDLARKGKVSIGLDRKPNGRPDILVNRARLRAEGHEFSSQLLSLATVID